MVCFAVLLKMAAAIIIRRRRGDASHALRARAGASEKPRNLSRLLGTLARTLIWLPRRETAPRKRPLWRPRASPAFPLERTKARRSVGDVSIVISPSWLIDCSMVMTPKCDRQVQRQKRHCNPSQELQELSYVCSIDWLISLENNYKIINYTFILKVIIIIYLIQSNNQSINW